MSHYFLRTFFPLIKNVHEIKKKLSYTTISLANFKQNFFFGLKWEGKVFLEIYVDIITIHVLRISQS